MKTAREYEAAEREVLMKIEEFKHMDFSSKGRATPGRLEERAGRNNPAQGD